MPCRTAASRSRQLLRQRVSAGEPFACTAAVSGAWNTVFMVEDDGKESHISRRTSRRDGGVEQNAQRGSPTEELRGRSWAQSSTHAAHVVSPDTIVCPCRRRHRPRSYCVIAECRVTAERCVAAERRATGECPPGGGHNGYRGRWGPPQIRGNPPPHSRGIPSPHSLPLRAEASPSTSPPSRPPHPDRCRPGVSP